MPVLVLLARILTTKHSSVPEHAVTDIVLVDRCHRDVRGRGGDLGCENCKEVKSQGEQIDD